MERGGQTRGRPGGLEEYRRVVLEGYRMKDLDGQGGYFGNLLDNPLDDLYGLLTLLMCQVGTS